MHLVFFISNIFDNISGGGGAGSECKVDGSKCAEMCRVCFMLFYCIVGYFRVCLPYRVLYYALIQLFLYVLYKFLCVSNMFIYVLTYVLMRFQSMCMRFPMNSLPNLCWALRVSNEFSA